LPHAGEKRISSVRLLGFLGAAKNWASIQNKSFGIEGIFVFLKNCATLPKKDGFSV
jgi:hypothetical protein